MTLALESRPGSGRRKVAIALVALGPERAARLLRQFDEDEARELAAEVVALGSVSPDEVTGTLRELHGRLAAADALPPPGEAYARDLLVRTLGEQRGGELADEIAEPGPFLWLADADPEQAAEALAQEAPAAVALALVHLPAKAAARLLARLPDEVRRQVAVRIARLRAAHPDTVAEVDAALRRRVATVLAPTVQSVPGPAALAEMLAFTPRDQERELVGVLAEVDPELAEQVKAALLTFDDLAGLEARALQALLKAADVRELALALKGADETVLTPMLSNLSERARENLLEEIDLLTTVKSAEIAVARASVVATARKLEEEGVISIARPDDD